MGRGPVPKREWSEAAQRFATLVQSIARNGDQDGNALTQDEIADRLGCSQGYVSAILKGRRVEISIGIVARAIRAFRVPPAWFFQGKEDWRERPPAEPKRDPESGMRAVLGKSTKG